MIRALCWEISDAGRDITRHLSSLGGSIGYTASSWVSSETAASLKSASTADALVTFPLLSHWMQDPSSAVCGGEGEEMEGGGVQLKPRSLPF